MVLSLLGVLSLAHAIARVKTPDWLTTVSAKPVSMNYGDSANAVLLDETVVDLAKDGSRVVHRRFAVRVLTLDGKSAAVATADYETSSDKVKSFQAWHLPPSGEPSLYGKKDTINTVPYAGSLELYSESRLLKIDASRDVSPGSVFAYESVIEQKTLFSQNLWFFQGRSPVELSSFSLNLPDGWDARALTFNRATITPLIQGNRRTWSLSSLPAVPDEPSSPKTRDFTPWLAIDILPAAGDKSSNRAQSYESWADVSTFLATRYDPPAAPDEAIKAKAAALVAGATTTWERIARLCRHAQTVNYISIALNLQQAGGMTPRAAGTVLRSNYGDCKDKATYLRSLLTAQGIESFPVVVYSGSSTYVRAEWVSPLQFNHCILAIRVDESIEGPAIVNHPQLGRLLIFDPTNDDTPPGLLAYADLAGYGLVINGAKGDLVRLPPLRHEDNRSTRTIHARLSADGRISGTLFEKSHGYESVDERSLSRSYSETDYKTKILEPYLAQTLPAARVTALETKDDFDTADFSLKAGFESSAYGRVMRDSLLVLKPVLIARRNTLPIKKGVRANPLFIPARSFQERTEIELPEGFSIDEAFPPLTLDSSFGRYSIRSEMSGRTLVIERAFEQNAVTLPASEFEAARAYYEKILRAEQSPVVLKRI